MKATERSPTVPIAMSSLVEPKGVSMWTKLTSSRRRYRPEPPKTPISARSACITRSIAGFPGSVQAAGRVALEVGGDEGVSGFAERTHDAFTLSHEARDLRWLDLDAGHIAVMAHPDLTETNRFQGGLRGFDLAQRCDGPLGPVRDARGPACEC